VRPLAGALPEDIDTFEQIFTRLDRGTKWAPCHGASSFRCVPSSA